MSATLTELEEVLRREVDLHQELLEAAEGKRTAIILGDLKGLEDLLQRENRLIAGVEAEEAKRAGLIAAARTEFDLQEDPVRMQAIIARAPEPHAERLQRVRERLRETLDALRYRTRQNAELLRASIAHVDGFLHMVAQAGSPEALYGRDGRRKTGEFSLLDRSA